MKYILECFTIIYPKGTPKLRNKIYKPQKDALRSKDVRQGCITVFNHIDAMIGTMSAANFLALPDPMSTRTLLSKKEADGLRSGMR